MTWKIMTWVAREPLIHHQEVSEKPSLQLAVCATPVHSNLQQHCQLFHNSYSKLFGFRMICKCNVHLHQIKASSHDIIVKAGGEFRVHSWVIQNLEKSSKCEKAGFTAQTN